MKIEYYTRTHGGKSHLSLAPLVYITQYMAFVFLSYRVFFSHLLTLFYSTVVVVGFVAQTRAILPWILINGIVLLRSLFAHFVIFSIDMMGFAYSTVLDVRSTYFLTLIRWGARTYAHSDERTHFNTTRAHLRDYID